LHFFEFCSPATCPLYQRSSRRKRRRMGTWQRFMTRYKVRHPGVLFLPAHKFIPRPPHLLFVVVVMLSSSAYFRLSVVSPLFCCGQKYLLLMAFCNCSKLWHQATLALEELVKDACFSKDGNKDLLELYNEFIKDQPTSSSWSGFGSRMNAVKHACQCLQFTCMHAGLQA